MGVIERKTETVNLRLTPQMKQLLKSAAKREHRTLSNMIEALVIDYCRNNGLTVEADNMASRRTGNRSIPTTK